MKDRVRDGQKGGGLLAAHDTWEGLKVANTHIHMICLVWGALVTSTLPYLMDDRTTLFSNAAVGVVEHSGRESAFDRRWSGKKKTLGSH